jgi:hypothetical protein
MLPTLLLFAVQILFLIFLLQLFLIHGFSSNPFTLEDIRNVALSLIGLIYSYIQIGNPFDFYKKYVLGGYISFPWFRRQLRTHLAERLEYRKANLVGEGRKFVSGLYIERREAEKEFLEFVKSVKPCFAIIGESGVGKTNFILGLSEKVAKDHFQLFYQGVQLRGGLKSCLMEDLPWAFHIGQSLLEAGRLISISTALKDEPLIVFIDGLDDVPEDSRLDLVDQIRLLAAQGIKFVLGCKDVVWPSFIRSQGSNSAFSELVFHQGSSTGLPGYQLERCSNEELERAWIKYSAYFNLIGDLSEEVKNEASLFYMMRLIGETFRNQAVPNDLNSASLFEAYWKAKEERIGDPLSCNVVVRQIANHLIRANKAEVLDFEVWPEGLSPQLKTAFLGLQTENVLIIRTDGQRRWLSFFHEKFQSFAISILVGEWDRKANGIGCGQLADELLSGTNNPILVNAFEFFTIAYDLGESPLFATLLDKDFIGTVKLAALIHQPYKLSYERKEISVKEAERLIRRLAEEVKIINLLYKKYFPKLISRELREFGEGIGGFISIQDNFIARGFTGGKQNSIGSIYRDDLANLKDFDWKKYDIISSLHTGNWQSFDTSLPFIEAFEILNKDLEECFKNEHWREDYRNPRIGELLSPLLASERVWSLLLNQPIRGYRKGSQLGINGVAKALRLPNVEEGYFMALEDLIQRIRFEIVWIFLQELNMVVLQETGSSRTLTAPENDLVDDKTIEEWKLAKGMVDIQFREKYLGHHVPKALVGLLDALLALRTAEVDFPNCLGDYRILGTRTWGEISDEDLEEFFRAIMAKISVAFSSLIKSSFPNLGSVFSTSEVMQDVRQLEIERQDSGRWIELRYSLLDRSHLKDPALIEDTIIIGKKFRSPFIPSFEKLDIGKGEFYSIGKIYSCEIYDLPLSEIVFELIKQDLNSILGQLPFWHHIR